MSPKGCDTASHATPRERPGAYLDIVFFLGHQLEPWTPRTLEANGMGGSETMAWEMAKRLAKLGHRVRVFAHCDYVGMVEFDGVEWMDELAGGSHPLHCDVLIQSRRPDQLPIIAKVRVLWVHDVHVGEAFHPRQAVQFDLIWCLSNWHREFFLSCYPWLPPGKVEVTRNGIDVERFAKAAARRHPHRAIYSSSPDRGLMAAVQAWPAVRSAIPDAELHVFYGWSNWERSLELMGDNPNPNCSRAALEALKAEIAKTPGIIMRGRVNQKQLAEEMLQASVWFYPTWFSETSCITAMEAQAAGLWCVCPPLAALAETVLRGARYHESRIVEALNKAERPEVNVSCFSLDTLATDWEKRLLALVESARVNVVPKFEEAAQ